MNDTTDLNRFRELCFLHACGKLAGEDAEWMEATMARHPDWRAAFDADAALAGQMRGALDAAAHASAPLLAYEELIAVRRQRNSGSVRITLMARLLAWWRTPVAGGWAMASVAVLACVSVLQTYRLESGATAHVYRSLDGAPAHGAPSRALLQVVVADDATVGALRLQLQSLSLEIVQGPDAQGVFIVRVNSGSAEQAIARLRESKLVLDVSAVPR